MTELAGFLKSRLESYGAQVDCSRRTGVSPGTINKWMSGENSPNFESCLILADYLETDPARIFKMAKKPSYYRLYLRHLDRIQYQVKLHSRLQHLLENGFEERIERMLNELEADQGSIKEEPTSR